MSESTDTPQTPVGGSAQADAPPPRGASAAAEVPPIGFAEFHQELGYARGHISREFDELRESAGWIALSLAVWLAIIGYRLIKGNV